MNHLLKSRFSRPWLLAASLAIAACSGDSPSDPGVQPAQFGALVVSIGGLPPNVTAAVTVTGPGGYTQGVTATTVLTALAAGTYTVSVTDVTHEGATWTGAPSSQNIVVAAGATVNAPGVTYVLATGALSVTLSGLPPSAAAPITITGPEGFARTVSEATSLTGLKPGSYSIEAREVQLPSSRYAATPGTQQVEVVASLVPAQAHVTYAIASGSLAINITGLPQGIPAAVTVTGPDNYSASFTAETVIDKLAPGTYTVAAASVVSGSLFAPTPVSQQVAVPASDQAVAVNIIYVSTGTSLNVQVLGLPASIPATVTVSGPNGFSRAVAASELITGIPAGSYTVTATAITSSCTTFTPQPATQNVSVTAGQAQSASVNYASGAGGSLNLCIDGAYITQSIQSYDNSVPLVAGRSALLRVFVRASGSNSAQPSVRVRFYNAAGGLVSTMAITAPGPSVPTDVDEAQLGSSWNAQLAGAFVQPGLRLLVDVDPANEIPEASESDNLFPAPGIPVALDVRPVAPLYVRLVPVIQASRGDTARISESNKANFILPMQRMFPVSTIDADIREPYTYNGPELQSGGANWTTLLSEINATRVADNAGRMYYGLVRVGYNSGVAGLGYIGVPTAIGWDYPVSGPEVLAHEFGHNFGRLHAPCGNPSGVDGAYPYSSATIGMFGYDITSNTVKFPALRDLMSYCDPPWISDYTYRAIMNFRASNPIAPPGARAAASAQRGLLVWGRIEQGRLVLEPGFEVDAPATLPGRAGPHRIEGLGPAGETLFSLSFAGDRVADAPDPNEQTFAFVIPLTQLRGVALDRLRLSALGRQVELRGSSGGAVPTALRTAPARVRVTWNAAAARVALIRDARTGHILSLARGGAIDLSTTSDDLEVTLSDGVRSVRSRVRPR